MSSPVLDDFQRFIPEFAHKGRLFQFPSLFAYDALPPLDKTVPASYGLPEKYILVANQYWSHKNHKVVVDSIAHLRYAGLTIPVVLTGLPLDDRAPQNTPTSELLQGIAQHGLNGTIIPLGLVPRTDVVNLMRCAAAILQPSFFEGWGLSVQEALALGRPVICSDIPALRENAPNAMGYFDPHNHEALARLLAASWPVLTAGPDPGSETAALSRHREFGRTQSRALWALCTTEC